MMKGRYIAVTLALLAVALVLQYEVREYLRYDTSSYFYLRWFLNVGGVVFFAVASMVLAIRHWLRSQRGTACAVIGILLLGGAATIWVRSWTKHLVWDDKVLVNGLYFDRTTGKPMDGVYKLPSSWDGFGMDKECTKVQYCDGVPIGRWYYSFKGDPIQSGEYLEMPVALQDSIARWISCERSDLQLFSEGGPALGDPYLLLQIYSDQQSDSLVGARIGEMAYQLVHEDHQLDGVIVNRCTKEGCEWIYSRSVQSQTQD